MDERQIERFEQSYLAVTRKLKEMVRHSEFGLTGPQFFIMYLIHQKEQCRITELAEMIEVKPSAVTVMIERLFQNGFVVRVEDKQDRRIVLVKLTDKGYDVFRQVQQMRKAYLHQLLSQLETNEMDSLVNTFEKLAHFLSKKETN